MGQWVLVLKYHQLFSIDLLGQEADFLGFLTQEPLLSGTLYFHGTVWSQGFCFRGFNLNGTTNFRGLAPFVSLPLLGSTSKVVTFKWPE